MIITRGKLNTKLHAKNAQLEMAKTKRVNKIYSTELAKGNLKSNKQQTTTIIIILCLFSTNLKINRYFSIKCKRCQRWCKLQIIMLWHDICRQTFKLAFHFVSILIDWSRIRWTKTVQMIMQNV